jgi:alkanesulfonate monooxygenase SsuD/methylene tetrahydromethanopterin reductase-like flavin-dependent oxidoreductase (luciferase family)
VKTRFGLGLSVYDSIQTLELGTLADRLGYDSVWITDHLVDLEACKIDPWVVLGGIGAKTSKVMLGTAVTDVQRIHPAKLAHMIATLDEMTGGGRVALGIGTGEAMNLVPFGLEWEDPDSRIARLAEAIQVVRLLWKSSRDSPVEYLGEHFQISNAWLDQKLRNPMPKIYIGALHSSKLLRLTGKYGDGWLDFLSLPSLFQNKVARIKEGTEESGRRIDDIDRTVWLGVSFTKDAKELALGLQITKILLASERNSLVKLGIDVQTADGQKYINFIPTRSEVDKAVKASEKVPSDTAKQFMIYGDSVKEASDLLDSFVKAGATHFQFSMLTAKTREMIERFSERVLSNYIPRENEKL